MRLYALLAYVSFLLSSAWAVAFLAGRGIDGPATSPAWAAVAIDSALLLIFAAHHSVLARAGVKKHLSRLIPPIAERSTFVLVASLLLAALLACWQPIPHVLWQVGAPWSVAIWVVYALGWVIVAWSTFMVDHADFLGLRHSPPAFTERLLYRWSRHPMMLGLVIAFWATPRMTAGHLLFAVASTAYIAVGIRFEERDLRARFGAEYEDYAKRVPALVPVSRSRSL